MKAGKMKCGDYVLCIRDRLHNGDILHKKGEKYRISDIFIDQNKCRIIQLITEIPIGAQYAYDNKDVLYKFFDYFFTNEIRKRKLYEILKKN